jgi:hypothetical protein
MLTMFSQIDFNEVAMKFGLLHKRNEQTKKINIKYVLMNIHAYLKIDMSYEINVFM